jgi:hypothetical protein
MEDSKLISAIRTFLAKADEVLDRLNKTSRDVTKNDYRNNINVGRSCKLNSQSKKDFWVSHEYSINVTTRYDDDEPNKEQTIPELKGYLDEEIETFEQWYCKRYESGKVPVKRSKSTRF